MLLMGKLTINGYDEQFAMENHHAIFIGKPSTVFRLGHLKNSYVELPEGSSANYPKMGLGPRFVTCCNLGQMDCFLLGQITWNSGLPHSSWENLWFPVSCRFSKPIHWYVQLSYLNSNNLRIPMMCMADGYRWVQMGTDGYRWVQMGTDGYRGKT